MKTFPLLDEDRFQIVQWLREYYNEVSLGKSWNYMGEKQRKICYKIGDMVSKLGYNAMSEGMDF